jgi:hypothetical protein
VDLLFHNSKPVNMKRLWIVFVLSLIIASSSLAQQTQQSSDCEGAFSKGTSVIAAGIGLGDLYWGTGYTSNFPVNPTLIYDYALTNKLGIGNIGIGLMVSYASSKYNDGYGDTYNYSGVLAGVRGTYHFILTKIDKLDPYAGVMFGYIFTSSSNNGGYDLYGTPGKTGGFQPGIFAGAHYYFSPVFGVTGELGYNGFSILFIGIALRFGGCSGQKK